MYTAPDFTEADYRGLFDVVDDLIRHRGSESTEASDFIATLHGARGESAQRAALTILRHGFDVKRRGVDMGHKGFVGACIAHGNPALATLVIKAGPPTDGLEEPWTSNQPWVPQAPWVDFLCSYDCRPNGGRDYQRDDARNYVQRSAQNIYGTLLLSLGQVKGKELTAEMVELLRASYHPEHPGLEKTGVPPDLSQRLPGNFHHALLHVALFGTTHVADVLTRAQTISPAPRAFDATALAQHDVAMALLGFLQDVKANRPKKLGRPYMDAGMFAMAAELPPSRNPQETLRKLIGWYVSAGWVDLDARLGSYHAGIADCMPLDVALWSGGPPAAVFLELGCDLANPELMFNQTGEGIIAAAQRSNRPETAPLVTEALLRRQLKDAASGRAAEVQAVAPERRRRMSV